MKLILDGNYWDPDDEWSGAEIEVEIVDDDFVAIRLLRDGEDDTPVLLKIEILQWAIKTLTSAAKGDRTPEEQGEAK